METPNRAPKPRSFSSVWEQISKEVVQFTMPRQVHHFRPNQKETLHVTKTWLERGDSPQQRSAFAVTAKRLGYAISDTAATWMLEIRLFAMQKGWIKPRFEGKQLASID